MSDLKEILESIDPEYFLDREGIEYRLTSGSSGEQLNVKTCPFCGQAKWKVFMNAQHGAGNCFSGSCETKFSKYKFIRQHFGLSHSALIPVIKDIAAEQGWRPKVRKRERLDIFGTLKLPDSVELPEGESNHIALVKRGIDIPTTRYFDLRFCKEGFYEYELNGTTMRQSYDERIIIPIYDLDGEMVAFQGRDVTGNAPKKYIFPPGRPSSGHYLYNGHNAIGIPHVVICEGVFDVMSTHMALCSGRKTDMVAIGTFGKHISEGNGNDQIAEFLRLKRKGLTTVTFLWDGEIKALRDAANNAVKLRKIGLKTRVAKLPLDKDPNEVPQHVILEVLEQACELDRKNTVSFILRLDRWQKN